MPHPRCPSSTPPAAPPAPACLGLPDWCVHVCRCLLPWLLAVACLAHPLSVRAEVLPRLNAAEVYVGAPFTVTFELEGTGAPEPDLAPLAADFDVQGSVRSSHLSLEDGALRRRQHLTLTLVARRAGELRLPALSFGQERSTPVAIAVREQSEIPSDEDQVALELDLSPETVFVQEQVLMTVRVVRPVGVDLDSARLSEPRVSGGDAVIETLGKDRAYRVERAGRRFEVIERRFAIIPQSSGELRVEPMRLDARRVSGSLSLANPFGVRIVPVQLRSEAGRIVVKRAPAAEAAAGWLPARNLTLTQAWSGLDETGRARLGEPVVRTIGILAEGLSAAQLPALDPPPPQGANQFRDAPNLATQHHPEGLSAQRTERLVIVPTRTGAIDLPAIELSWWNVAAARSETARLPPLRLEVLPVAGAAAPGVPAAPGEAAEAGQAAERPAAPFEAAGADDGARVQAPLTAAWSAIGWALGWIALGLLLGLLLSRVPLRAWQRGEGPLPRQGGDGADLRQAMRELSRLREAASRNDAEAAQRGLILLAPWLVASAGRMPRTVGALLDRLPDGALRDAVAELLRHRYGADGAALGPWNGRALHEALRPLRLGVAKATPSSVSLAGLPAFNPRH